MEIVLNFEKKELVVKQAANIKELYKRLKKLLGEDLESWTVVSDGVTWYYPVYPTYPWPRTTGEWTVPATTIYGLSDAVQTTAEFKVNGEELVDVVSRSNID
jgi:hypothetical protein